MSTDLSSDHRKKQRNEVSSDLRSGPGNEAVAIVGIGCRFPGKVEGPADLWEMMLAGKTAFDSIPKDRGYLRDCVHNYLQEAGQNGLAALAGHDEFTGRDDLTGQDGSGGFKGGFIEDLNRYDAAFFANQFPKLEIPIEPQQLLLAETIWKSLEDARFDPASFYKQKSAAFFDLSGTDFSPLLKTRFGQRTSMGGAASVISDMYGIDGPCLAFESSRSASLQGLYLAIRSLQKGAVDVALAGAVSCVFSPQALVDLIEEGHYSESGQSLPLTEDADGMLRAEGCGVLVLKRLSDAVAQGDAIYAQISGAAIGHTLAGAVGLAQQTVLKKALAEAQLTKLNWAEVEGSGSVVADCFELKALQSFFAALSSPVQLTTVKSSLGHMGSCSGMASLIKVASCLARRKLPPLANFTEPTRQLNWKNSSVKICHRGGDFSEFEGTLSAGVASFGLAGGNAYFILEELPEALKAAQVRAFSQPRSFDRTTPILKKEELEDAIAPAVRSERNDASSQQPIDSRPQEIDVVLREVVDIALNLIEMPPQTRVDPNRKLSEFGLDSLNTSSFLKLLNEQFGADLKPSFYLDYPSLLDLSEHLLSCKKQGLASGGNSLWEVQAVMPVAAQLEAMEQQALEQQVLEQQVLEQQVLVSPNSSVARPSAQNAATQKAAKVPAMKKAGLLDKLFAVLSNVDD